MAALKSLNKMFTNIRGKPASRTRSADPLDDSASSPGTIGMVSNADPDSPERIAARNIKQFCEAGPNNTGDEVTFLPPIVDAAESSPAAAAECARVIRHILGKEYRSKPPTCQYNAIMLIRILSDNPGPTFTRNLDRKFVGRVKDLLRNPRDERVRNMLVDVLDLFESTKAYDEGLALMMEMWKKEKKAHKAYMGRPPLASEDSYAQPFGNDLASAQHYPLAQSNRNQLPDPIELANRLEEARTSSKLLEQFVTSTPPHEFLSNDLIQEFAERCTGASRSIQGYMSADVQPPPDHETMESLIDTNELLQTALNQHKRAELNAKKHMGIGERSSGRTTPSDKDEQNGGGHSSFQNEAANSATSAPAGPSSSGARNSPPTSPRRKLVGNGKGKAAEVYSGAAGPWSASPTSPVGGASEESESDPFRDPKPEAGASSATGQLQPSGGRSSGSGRRNGRGLGQYPDAPRLAGEPFHPGFTASPTTPRRPDDSATTTSEEDEDDTYSATPQWTRNAKR